VLFILWGLLSLAVILSFDLLSFGLGRRGWRRFASTFFLFYSQVILSEFVLGLIGVLTGASLAIVNGLLAVALLAFVVRKYSPSIFKQAMSSWGKAIKVSLSSVEGDGLYVALLALATGVIAWIIFLGVIFPVTDFDGNSYHMTYIAEAIQNHSILDQPTSIPWLAGYPKGGELTEMWNVMIPHSDALADLWQIPFLFLGIIALYVLSLRVGASKKDARFAALLLVFVPVVINLAKTTYVDLMLVALFFAALAMTTMRKLAKLDFVVIGIIYGLLLAVKSTGLVFILATVPFLLMNFVTVEKRKLVVAQVQDLRKLLLVLAPTLFGIYWYVKDFALYGSPLYPFGLKILGKTIFAGQTFQAFIANQYSGLTALPNGMLHRVWFVWTERQTWYGCLYGYDTTYAGLGPLWFVLLLPAIFVGIIVAIQKRNYLFLWIVAVLGVVFLVYPANFYTRYTVFIVGLGIIAYALISTTFSETLRTLTRLVAILLALNVIATAFTLCNFPPDIIMNQLTAFGQHDRRGGEAYVNSIGPAYIFLQRTIQPGETVAYDSKPYFIYALWRPDYSNKVVYIPAANKQAWYASIKRANVKYVFIDTLYSSKEGGWIRSDHKYTSIYKDNMYDIYKVF
jgi:hypothetical protein